MASYTNPKFEPIQIIEGTEDYCPVPNQNTHEQALCDLPAIYDIYLKLSQQPSAKWINLFINIFDNSFHSKHTKGITSVTNDGKVKIVNMSKDIYESYYKKALREAIQKANNEYQAFILKQ